ncbi:MAG: hypothetical protein AAGA54_10170 [Myxococcota bacterium]
MPARLDALRRGRHVGANVRLRRSGGVTMLWVALGPAAVTTSVLLRARREEHHGDRLEQWTLGIVVAMTFVGMAGVLLGLFSLLDPIALTLACLSLAAMLWPWRADDGAVRPAPAWGRMWIPLAIGLLAVGLRVPSADYALAGRDQGTYTLRAQHTIRTHGFEHHDGVLARASAEHRARPGPGDLLGLYPKRSERWREDTYEGAYRPGWYLADRDRGRVVPQFFHLHPTWMAIAGMIAGPPAVHGVIVFEAFLLVLVIYFVARRVFGSSGWAALTALVIAANPLAIWVHRTALSETPTSLLLWAAVLSIVRCPDHDTRGLDRGALLLGATAWVRGNAWLTAPLLLGVLWLLPGHAPQRRRPVFVYLTVLVGSVFAHAASTFPYLADELNKQLHVTWLRTPWTLVGGALCLVVVWSSVDALAFDRRDDGPRRAWTRRTTPLMVAAVALGGVVLYGVLFWISGGRTHARLDPAWALFGPVLIPGALLALPGAALRARLTRARDVWLTAICATLAATVLLYAQRNLPRAGLFYYGRYLAPELLPIAALLCVASLSAVTARLRGWAKYAFVAAAVAGLVWTVAGPLVRTPTTRLREFDGADRLVDGIAAALEPGAVVIAGGEGWHHGHTYNQVGGALAMKHGVDVVPYYGREALYGTAMELLEAGPRARGEAPPPVYLLVGEATHHMRPEPSHPPRAAFDGRLPPPLTAVSATAFELFTDRLTPVERTMPGRVTRDELRMVLVRLALDPNAQVSLFPMMGPSPALPMHGGGTPSAHGVCLDKDAAVTFTLPPGLGEGSLAIVMTPGTDGPNAKRVLTIDGNAVLLQRARAAARPRDTLGPIALSGARTVTLRGSTRGRLKVPCPFGGVAEIRWLGPDRPTPIDRLEAVTLGPAMDLGHAVEPTVWVAGAGLSRYRPTFETPPEVVGLSLVLRPEAPLVFGRETAAAPGPLHAVVTLTHADVSPSARLELWIDDRRVASLDPPDTRRGTWQSPVTTVTPRAPTVHWSLRLVEGDPDDVVHVRDLGLFGTATTVRSVVAPRGTTSLPPS